MSLSEQGRIHKAHGLAHWAIMIFLLLLYQMECLLYRLLHVLTLLVVCSFLAFACCPRQAIVQTRPGDVCESLDARRARDFSTLLRTEQVLAYLLLREVAQFQLEIGEITFQV